MSAAAEAGAEVRNGVSMLAYQGALSLARWTGADPPAELMRSRLAEELARRQAG